MIKLDIKYIISYYHYYIQHYNLIDIFLYSCTHFIISILFLFLIYIQIEEMPSYEPNIKSIF